MSSTCFGRNYRPKHVELIEIINKIIVVTSIDCFYYCTMNLFALIHNIHY